MVLIFIKSARYSIPRQLLYRLIYLASSLSVSTSISFHLRQPIFHRQNSCGLSCPIAQTCVQPVRNSFQTGSLIVINSLFLSPNVYFSMYCIAFAARPLVWRDSPDTSKAGFISRFPHCCSSILVLMIAAQ